MMGVTVAVVLLWTAAAQSTIINIDAIEPCTFNFTFSSAANSSLLSSCSYFLPGATLNSSDWATCYLWCCPGLVQPVNSTLNDMQSCVAAFKETPFVSQSALSW